MFLEEFPVHAEQTRRLVPSDATLTLRDSSVRYEDFMAGLAAFRGNNVFLAGCALDSIVDQPTSNLQLGKAASVLIRGHYTCADIGAGKAEAEVRVSISAVTSGIVAVDIEPRSDLIVGKALESQIPAVLRGIDWDGITLDELRNPEEGLLSKALRSKFAEGMPAAQFEKALSDSGLKVVSGEHKASWTAYGIPCRLDARIMWTVDNQGRLGHIVGIRDFTCL